MYQSPASFCSPRVAPRLIWTNSRASISPKPDLRTSTPKETAKSDHRLQHQTRFVTRADLRSQQKQPSRQSLASAAWKLFIPWVVGAPQPADLAQEAATNANEAAMSSKVAQAVRRKVKKMTMIDGDCQA